MEEALKELEKRLVKLEKSFETQNIGPTGRSKQRYSQKDIEQLQDRVHKVTGDGEVMKIFNNFLGVNNGASCPL